MQRNKLRFDRHVTASDLSVGDCVLVRNVGFRGRHKLADKWESKVYIVIKRAGTLPVYTVRPANKDSPLRTLHRDLLLPCGYLPAQIEIPVGKQTRRPGTHANPDPSGSHVDSDGLSEEDDISTHCCSGLPSSGPFRFNTIIYIPKDSIMAPSTAVSISAETPQRAVSVTNLEAAENAAPNLSDYTETANSPASPNIPEDAGLRLDSTANDAAEESAYSPTGNDLLVSLETFNMEYDEEPPTRPSNRTRKPLDRLQYTKF